MELSPQSVRELAAQASSLDERLAQGMSPRIDAQHEQLIEQRWAHWCQLLVRQDWLHFQQRFRWDHLDIAQVRSLLGAVQWPDELPLPTWTALLQDVLRATAIADQTAASCLDPAEPLPFETLLLPFVTVALGRLRERAGLAWELLSAAALSTLQRELLKTLALYAAPAFYLEFSLMRAQHLSSLTRLLRSETQSQENACYLSFVKQMQAGGLAGFFQEYAVLARQLSVISELWTDFLAEFLTRLSQDYAALQERLTGGTA
jgi:hypothetical protein